MSKPWAGGNSSDVPPSLTAIAVIDSGGCTLKLGLAHRDQSPKITPNCTARAKGDKHYIVGDAILATKDISSLTIRRPVDRGYVIAWDLQKEIWARALKSLLANSVPLTRCGLVLTEPYLQLPGMREAALSVVFDDLQLSSVVMLNPAPLLLRWHSRKHQKNLANTVGCALVVDAGFSSTHAVPVFDWRVIPSGIKRIDLGGKALSNFLRELVSYRSINLMDETLLIEHIKEQLCFVSQNVKSDLAEAKKRNSAFKKEYLLPDGVVDSWGHVRTEEEIAEAQAAIAASGPAAKSFIPKEAILVVNNERFMVPEALFHPSDLGMDEAGLAETIAASIESVHPQLRGLLYSNIVVSGGTARCPGFVERLTTELRPLVPDDYEINLTLADDPIGDVWRGGAVLAASHEYTQLAVTAEDYRCGRALLLAQDRWG